MGGFSFEDETGNTRLSRWTELEAGGLKGRLLGILAPLVQRSQVIELSNLKCLVESLPGPAGDAAAPIPAVG